MVSYTSNEPLNHVWKGGEHLPPTLNEQTSIYLQIAKMLEDGILRGIYPEDTQVPSTNELARTLCINPATAAKGLNLLTEDGILYKRRGIGMFVAPRAAEKIHFLSSMSAPWRPKPRTLASPLRNCRPCWPRPARRSK